MRINLTSSLSSAVALVGLVTLLPHCGTEDDSANNNAGAAGSTVAGAAGTAGAAGRAGAANTAGKGGGGEAGEPGGGEAGTGEGGEAGTAEPGGGTGGALPGGGAGGSLAGGAGTAGTGTAGTAGAGTAGAAGAATIGQYVAGDFHNHTTCSDGTISMQKLVGKATGKTDGTFGLDWFVQAGHGGNGNRNCTLVEDASLSTPAYPYSATYPLGPNTTWDASGVTVKGDASIVTADGSHNMWRWQSIQEFQYPLIEYLNAQKNLPLWLGIETVAPGHEHVSMSVITGQIPTTVDTQTLPTAPPYTAKGNANALAQWEYCFDRGDTDTSRGTASNNFDCSVTGSANTTDVSWNATGHKLIPAAGAGHGTKGHLKTLEALKWMVQNHPNTSYYVPAHLERAGQFYADGDNGFNVESLRDFNNTAPKIAFGFESQPGHGASANRGEYQVERNLINGVKTDSVGGTTFGGTGVYAGIVGGVWDSLLGEGRNWWFFASSDWHNRGVAGPDDRHSTQDFFPGEYQRTYTLVPNAVDKLRPQAVVDALRSGNEFSTGGQLIDRLGFVACTGMTDPAVAALVANAAQSKGTLNVANCATMGQKLVVNNGTGVTVGIAVRDPDGVNFSPYTFPNPSLKQITANPPAINKPVLDHIDLIGGLVSGYRTPGTAGYAGAWPANTAWLLPDGTTTGLASVPDAAKNTTAQILKTFSAASGVNAWSTVTATDGTKYLVMTFKIIATTSQYVRLRGTNLPPSVPFETDASGNPLSDVYTNANDPTRLRIPCTVTATAGPQFGAFDGCPDYLPTATSPATGTANPIAGQKAVAFDIAAWSDLWFYANPIYFQVNGSTVVAGVQ